MKLSSPQRALLFECAKYSIMDDRKRRHYYRLGGYGYAPIGYRRGRMLLLEKAGLVTWGSVRTATDKGKALLVELGYQLPQSTS